MTDEHGAPTGPSALASTGPSALASALVALLRADFDHARRPRTVIGVAGESGSGKSVTASELAAALTAAGTAATVLNQDDYFHLPPATNHLARERDLAVVGPGEVNLALLAEHVAAFREARADVAVPTVDYPGNRFLRRRVDFTAAAALVVEGTYVLQLDDLDVRIFLAATWADTRERRRLRNRDIIAPIIDTILDIEHRIISRQAAVADVIVDEHFSIVRTRR